MTVMEFLNQVQELKGYIEVRKREAECWRSMARSISASNFEPHYDATRNTSAQYEKAIERADEIERDIEEKQAQLVEVCEEVNTIIDKLNDAEKQMVLRYRYVEGFKWADVARVINRSRSTVIRIHNEAVEKLSECF